MEDDAFFKMGDWGSPCKFSFELDKKMRTTFLYKSPSEDQKFKDFWQTVYQEGKTVPQEINVLLFDGKQLTFLDARTIGVYFGEYNQTTEQLELIVEWRIK